MSTVNCGNCKKEEPTRLAVLTPENGQARLCIYLPVGWSLAPLIDGGGVAIVCPAIPCLRWFKQVTGGLGELYQTETPTLSLDERVKRLESFVETLASKLLA